MKKFNQSSYAELKMIALLGKKLNGSSTYIKKHKSRALLIARAIDERFHTHVYSVVVKLNWPRFYSLASTFFLTHLVSNRRYADAA